MDTQTPVTPPTSSKSPVPLIVGALVVVAVAGVGVYLSVRAGSKTTDSRSRAAIENFASSSVVTKEGTATPPYVIQGDASKLASSVSVRSFDTTMELSLPAVLGTSTETQVSFCLDDVSEESGKYFWKTSCHGDKTVANCVANKSELSGAEKNRYLAWKRFNKPEPARCQSIGASLSSTVVQANAGTNSVSASPIAAIPATTLPNSTPVATTTTAAVTIPAQTTEIYKDAYVTVMGFSSDLVEYQRPVVTTDVATKIMTIRVQGRVKGSQTAGIFSGVFPIATVSLNQPITPAPAAKLTAASIKGTRPEAPNVEVELLQK